MSSLTTELIVGTAALAAVIVGCTWREPRSETSTSRASPKQLIERMAPNVKGSGFEWKDPTLIYLDGVGFASTVDHLLDQLEGTDIEVVAGIDAAGYVLGAALASRLGVGFLCIRKGGSLPVPTDEVTYSYSKGSGELPRGSPGSVEHAAYLLSKHFLSTAVCMPAGKRMEMRAAAFPPRCRVAVVDQWVDSGGSMRAAIELVERQQGVVRANSFNTCLMDVIREASSQDPLDVGTVCDGLTRRSQL